VKDRHQEISERIEKHLSAEIPCLIPKPGHAGLVCHETMSRSWCHCEVAGLLAEVKRMREVVEAARLFEGGNCICAYGTRGNPCRVCKLKAALAALSAMGEP